MKKYLTPLLFSCCNIFMSFHVQAEEITYPGATLGDPNTEISGSLESNPNSLFPKAPSGNTVILNSGDSKPYHVFGGITYDGAVNNNTVTVNGGEATGNITGGWAKNPLNSGNITGNKIIINSGKIGKAVYGAWLEEGSGVLVKNNSVLIENGTFGSSIYGAYAQGGGIVEENSVTINNAITQSGTTFVAAGYAGTAGSKAIVKNNSTTINGGTFAYADVYGGKSTRTSGGDISGNTITITGGTIGGKGRGNVYGGYGFTSAGNILTVNDNIADIINASVSSSVYGGYATSGNAADTANNNTVNLDGTTTVGKDVYGGYSDSNKGTTDSNIVNIGGATAVGGDVYGGYSINTANNNAVKLIETAAVAGNVYGGYAGGTAAGSADSNAVNLAGAATVGGNVYGGYSNGANGSANGNAVDIAGAATVGADVYGAYSNNTANNNSVTLGGTAAVTGNIYGSYANGTNGSSDDNIVNIAGAATVGADVYGAYSNGTANNNIVKIIETAAITGNVYGGYADGAADNNTVNLGDTTTVAGDVYGAYSNGTATNNTVNLGGSVNIDGDVYGANKAGANTVNLLEGNITVGGTLFGNGEGIMDGTLNASSGSITNALQAHNFAYTNLQSGSQINLTSTSANALHVQHVTNDGLISFFNDTATPNVGLIEGAYTGSGSIGLDVKFGTDALETDADSIVFTNKPSDIVSLQYKPTTGSVTGLNAIPIHVVTFTNGIAADGDVVSATPHVGIYTTEIIRIDNKYYLYLSEEQAPTLAKPHSGGRAARLAIASKGVDMLLQEGLNDAITKTGRKGWGIATQIGYNKESIGTGSHVNIEGMSGLVTLAYNKNTPFSVGVFGEFFTGNYGSHDTVNIDQQRISLHGEGDIESYGGGAFLQYRPSLAVKKPGDFIAWLPGVHIEAVARLGYSYADFEDHASVYTKIDRKGVMHYGAALGGGYVINHEDKFMVDLYGNAIWTRQEGATVTDNLQQEIRAKGSDSMRLIAGVHVGHAITDTIRPYAGLSLDYESMGKPDVYVDNIKAKTTSLKGLTSNIQAGVNFRAANDENLFFGIKGNASFGKREGGGGSILMRRDF